MALFFTTTLVISILGMTALVGLKRWELATGRVLGAGLRPAVGEFFHKGLMWLEQVAPALLRRYARILYRMAHHLVHRIAALGVLLLEHVLERTLRTLRHKTEMPRSDAEASGFLREVAEHKKKLLSEAQERAIYEE